MNELQTEWAILRAALRAHVDWLAETGVDALPACDDATLEERRARYRAVASESASGLGLVGAALASTGGASDAASGPDGSTEADPVPSVTVAPTERSPALALERSRPETQAHVDLTLRVDGPPELQRYALPVVQTDHPAPRQQAGASTTDFAVHASDLSALAEEVKGCERCELHRTRTQTVFARGTGSSGLCFIGEGPGVDEDAQGLPFVGAAGQLLDKMIAAMGLDRDEVYVCNIVKCRPPKNRKPERLEMQACSGFLARQLDFIAPKVIVALGGTAVEGLLGLSGIVRLRGQWRLYRGEIPVMPTFHPAYLLRQPEAKREVWNDLKLVLDHLGRPLPAR
jgi:uracil-DNA glycosylase